MKGSKHISIILVIMLVVFSAMSQKQGKVVTVVNYANGNIKMKSTVKPKKTGRLVYRHDRTYYRSGQLKSTVTTVYRDPANSAIEKDPGRRFSLIKKKVYKEYYEDGTLKETGSLHMGAGKIKVYDENGKLTQVRTIQHFVPIKIKDVLKE